MKKNMLAGLLLLNVGIGYAGSSKHEIESIDVLLNKVNISKQLSKLEYRELKIKLQGIRKYEEKNGEYVRGLAADDIVVTRAVMECMKSFAKSNKTLNALAEYQRKVGLAKAE